MQISDFDYELPDERIAKFPAVERDASKLLVWNGTTRDEGTAGTPGDISETIFRMIGEALPPKSLLVFNNTRVVRARLIMRKPAAGTARKTESTGTAVGGARVEVLCLEPSNPADYGHAFAAMGSCEWKCMVGNLKKWKAGPLEIPYTYNGTEHRLQAWRAGETGGGERMVRFEWDSDIAFGQLLELLGRVPVPPYLGREDEAIDKTRYQTVYSRIEGSVAAPTAGLHFTPELIERLGRTGVEFEEVTLHVGAGTFLPVKVENALDHRMHTEHFEVRLAALEHLSAKSGNIIAVGTTSVRTLESLAVLGWRIERNGNPEPERPVGQFEAYDIPESFESARTLEALAEWMRGGGLEKITASTRVMITPAGFRFRIVNGIVTNFHQPKSTLLLLIAAFAGTGAWRRIYDYALSHDFRFLSYGDSSLLLKNK